METDRLAKQKHLIYCRTSKEIADAGLPTIVRGEGVRVFDAEGRSYLDLVSGVTRPVHVGYGREEIAKAVYDQARTMAYFTPMNYSNAPAEDLAVLLAELTPEPLSRFMFVCDGSEAVETALKLAKQYHHFRGEPQRYKIISRRGAYHGVTSGALRALGTVLSMRQIMEPLPPGSTFIESPYCYRCPYRMTYPSCDLYCADMLERTIEFEDPSQVSAFIGEPIQQGFGALSPPPGYWERVREITRKHEVILIVDEVICGFGRTGRWFGIQHFGIEPDLITMAKGISSGYVPLGGVGAAPFVMEPITTFEHLHTYANHPVSCAAALANIDIMTRENLIANSAAMGAYFLDRLKELEGHPLVGEARGQGLWLAVDLVLDKKTRSMPPLASLGRIIARAREKGLVVKSMNCALELAPPLVITKSEIDEAMPLLTACLDEEAKELGLA